MAPCLQDHIMEVETLNSMNGRNEEAEKRVKLPEDCTAGLCRVDIEEKFLS